MFGSLLGACCPSRFFENFNESPQSYASYLISVGARAPIGSHVLEEFPDQTASAATHPRTATTLIASAPFTALSASRSTVGLLHSVRCDSP